MPLRPLLALLCLLCAAGCGERAAPTPPEEAGPPMWRAARDEGRRDATLLDLRAAAPCRLRVGLLGTGPGAVAQSERLLAAGESVRLWVSVAQETQPRTGGPVSAADAAEGRTEAWVATLAYGWDDQVGARRPEVTGTRPGRGRALGTWTVTAPVLAAPLPYDRDLEVACAAIADGGGELTLDGRETGSRVRGALDAAAGDRVTLLRLVVRAERMGP